MLCDTGQLDENTTAIAIQDVPEGFVVAAALLAAGYGRGLVRRVSLPCWSPALTP